MRRIILVLLFLLFAAPICFAQRAKTDTVFFDDFNGPALDRSKWNVEVTGTTNNDEQQAYVDSSSVLYFVHGKAAQGARKGALVIKPIFHPGYTSKENRKYDFLSARINTEKKFQFTYGTATARMKISSGPGLWPAFWALGNGTWPECGEIDMMETVGDSSWISNALHGPNYFGNTPITYRYYLPKKQEVDQWHTYSVDWTRDKMIFKTDGIITYTVTRSMIEKYGRWAFDDPKFLIFNFALGGGYPNGVNKITSPYFGISQSTVDKIKAGKAVILVDWVLVTKKK